VDAGNYIQPPSEPKRVGRHHASFQPINRGIFPIAEDNLPQLLETGWPPARNCKAVAFDRSQTTKLANGTLIALDSQIDPDDRER